VSGGGDDQGSLVEILTRASVSPVGDQAGDGRRLLMITHTHIVAWKLTHDAIWIGAVTATKAYRRFQNKATGRQHRGKIEAAAAVRVHGHSGLSLSIRHDSSFMFFNNPSAAPH